MQCPSEYPAAAVLVALSAIIGRQLGIRPKRLDDWLVVPNLWGAVIGRPGLLKSPAIAETLKPLHALANKVREDHETKAREWSARSFVREEGKKVAKRAVGKALEQGQDAEAIAREYMDAELDDPFPTRRRYTTTDATVEKLGELLAENQRGIFVNRDELAGWLAELDKEGREGSRQFYLTAWNGDSRYTYDRIGRGTVEIEAACVSILGTIQPGPLSKYLYGALHQGVADDGLLQRFQITVWPDILSKWRNVDRPPDPKARDEAWRVYERLDALDPEVIGATLPPEGGIPYIRFAQPAQEVFNTWREGLEQRLRTGDDHPAFEAHLAKYRSLVPSIALICHLVDSPEDGEVAEDAVWRAIGWAAFLESHARRLFAPALDPTLAAAVELDRRILKGDLKIPFTARDVYRKGWRLLTRESTQLALEYLADYGRIWCSTVHTDGRPKVVWEVNPLLLQARQKGGAEDEAADLSGLSGQVEES